MTGNVENENALKEIWVQVVSCLAELDCLCSLARLGSEMKLACIPHIESDKDGNEQSFELRGAIHPCLARSGQRKFVPNDVVIENKKKTFLITGPNMGGKSTLMRTVCVATIMAQVGSLVPAQSFKLTPVDRIFTRIGAKDSLQERKSTFYTELEETFVIVDNAKSNSLVIIDELGRGTSTYDGVALAYAILKYLTEEINCMTLFATHYHILVDEFRLYRSVCNYHMDYQFTEGMNLELTYKFLPGEATQSFGINAARIAGISEIILKRAQQKSMIMTKENKHVHYKTKILKSFNQTINALEILDKSSIVDLDYIYDKLHEAKNNLPTDFLEGPLFQ